MGLFAPQTPGRPSATPLGTEQHFRWLHGIVKTLLVLNLVDAVFTLLWVWTGAAEEANPLLDELVSEHPVAFAACKLALVGLGSLLLWRLRERPLAVVAIFGAFVAYYLILLMHIEYLSWTVGIWLAP